ncbi:dihydrofolate reductase family protein [Spongiactinospora rosea]|uniref:dihydrofolate reductase family protein n=1 Tax=Spongiactinospora rosea TaxID=2248750 RepID=UPI0018F602A3|nr:dihydrofolate reductase family protein [Spongiactinospora rosea]
MMSIDDPEQERCFVSRLWEAGAFLLGRDTDEIMAGYRPTAEEIPKLKAEPGKGIVAAGGTTFMRSLIELGVVDEYRLCVLPAVAGKGAPLFPVLDQALNLRLVESTAFPPESSNWSTRRPAGDTQRLPVPGAVPRSGQVPRAAEPGRRVRGQPAGRGAWPSTRAPFAAEARTAANPEAIISCS